MKLKIKYFRIALVVLIFYSLCFLPISFPTISTTTFDLAKGLVENRIRDFVTLFVLSITISIFTIQAIRNMGLTNDKYFEFYEKSWMIDLLFYFVSSISGMVILSFMSEFLIKNHPDVYF